MFRLDYLNPDGTTDEPVVDVIMGGVFFRRHMATARQYASTTAQLTDRAILITRIVKAGQLKPSLVALPDGSFQRPPGSRPASEREDCRRDSGLPCFCSPCRAARRRV